MRYTVNKTKTGFINFLIVISFLVLINNPLTAQKLGKMPLARHSAALHANGTVFTWGRNLEGQVGDNTNINRWFPEKVLKGEYTGTEYLGDNTENPITEIALGGFHSIALAQDGTVFTWGDNTHGQLGDSSVDVRRTPVKVLKGEYEGTTFLGDNPTNPIVAVSLGFYFSMAISLNGTVYAWGENHLGQLGNNGTGSQHTPIRVLKGNYSGTTFLGDNPNNKIIDIATGEYFSIALAEDGTVFTWGRNHLGQLGDSTDTERHIPVKVLKGEYTGATYLGDDQNNKIIKVALGHEYSIALAEDGTVYSWGSNSNGQLGNNTVNDSWVPIRVLKGNYSGVDYLGDSSNNKVTTIAAGSFFSTALVEDGTVYNWGQNLSGQIGDNTNVNRRVPTHVLKGLYDGSLFLGDNPSNKIISISLGAQHVIALAEDLTLYSWGDVTAGKLGDSLLVFHRTPGRVHGVGNNGFLILPVEDENNLINDFELSQNYPNPFNPSTTIKYSVPNVTLSGVEGSRVVLKVYDVLGKEVSILINEEKPTGSYEVHFNATGLSSGIYFYKLQTGSFVETKKMILLR